MNLFIATDGHELCLWEGDRSDPQPRCVERESDVDPIVWSMILAQVDAIYLGVKSDDADAVIAASADAPQKARTTAKMRDLGWPVGEAS